MLPFNAFRRCAVLGLCAIAFLSATVADTQRGVPPTDGFANFARVTDGLWRGAQPDLRGLETLKKLGAATIINLRMADDVMPGEEAAAHRLGLVYENVPLPGLHAPSPAAVARVLALIASSPPPVFVHCEHGADRTGTIVACWRIRHNGWSAERALVEAHRYGLSDWEFGMKRFVRKFAPVPSAQQ